MASKNEQSKWARLRQIAGEEPKEADVALAEVADALGTMADALSNLRDNLDLIEAPKTASIQVRLATTKKYATAFKRIAEEAPEVVADAISEVYHSLDDVAGAIEALAENMGIDLDLTPVEDAFAEEGEKEVVEGEKEHPEEKITVDEEKFEEGEKELESSEAKPAEEAFDKEAKIKTKPHAYKMTPFAAGHSTDFCEECHKKEKDPIHTKKEKKADGSVPFITDRDNNAKPEAPAKLEIPEAQGSSEENKAASVRERTRNRIAKRYGIEL